MGNSLENIDGIKSLGCLEIPENQLWEHPPRDKSNLIFDIPGNFCKIDDYSFDNMSFTETQGNEFFGDLSLIIRAIADVKFKKIELGRHEIYGGLSQLYGPGIRKDFLKFLKERDLPIEGIKRQFHKEVGDALINWGNLRRYFNRDGTGIPYKVFLEDICENVNTIGFQNPAYLGESEKDIVFATPYVKFNLPSILDRLMSAYRIIKGEKYSMNKTKTRTKIFNRINLLNEKPKIPEEIFDADRQIIDESFEKLRKYLIIKPTVSRKTHS